MALQDMWFDIRADATERIEVKRRRARVCHVRFELPRWLDHGTPQAVLSTAAGRAIEIGTLEADPDGRCGFWIVLEPGEYTLRLHGADRDDDVLAGRFAVDLRAPAQRPILVPMTPL